MIGLPEIEHIKPNFTKLSVGDLWLWFSYTTPIAYRVLGEKRVVRVNDWSNTTGKHLNAIDGGDKKSRIPGVEFETRLKALTEGHVCPACGWAEFLSELATDPA